MYTLDAGLRAKLGELAAATKAAKAEARAASKVTAPIRERMRRVRNSLKTVEATRQKILDRVRMFGQDDAAVVRACECIYGAEWRDRAARIATLKAELRDLEIALLLNTTTKEPPT